MNFDIRIGTVSFSTETVLEALASLPFDEKRKLVCAMCGVSIMSDEAGCFFAAANSEQAIPPDVAFVEAAARNDPHEEEEEEEEEECPPTLRMTYAREQCVGPHDETDTCFGGHIGEAPNGPALPSMNAAPSTLFGVRTNTNPATVAISWIAQVFGVPYNE
jgi:hypothetical protein